MAVLRPYPARAGQGTGAAVSHTAPKSNVSGFFLLALRLAALAVAGGVPAVRPGGPILVTRLAGLLLALRARGQRGHQPLAEAAEGGDDCQHGDPDCSADGSPFAV
jgi:hypothetical protein